MTYRSLRTEDVLKVLVSIGFVDHGGRGGHRKLVNPRTGTMIVLPHARQLAPALVRAIVRQVSGRGDISEEKLENLLFGS
jgi:predicted RNA binding protein YcfA (HicA-like mRNA interferase family)